MKIRLLSDLHTEFRLPYKTHAMSEYRGEDVLVLAGDIASGATNTMDVIKHFLDCGFPRVIYVPGNHEYYGTSINDFDDKLLDLCEQTRGAHFLRPGTVTIDGVMFTGATLWTNFMDNPISQSLCGGMINDFRQIRNFRTRDAYDLYYKHLDYIQQSYNYRNDRKVVVVTHFLPARECIAPQWRGSGVLNDYFANDLGSMIADMQDTTWLFGHTHDATDFKIGNTRLVCNPHGYHGSSEPGTNGFDPFKVITV
jgi:predicted phosphodiesterase